MNTDLIILDEGKGGAGGGNDFSLIIIQFQNFQIKNIFVK